MSSTPQKTTGKQLGARGPREYVPPWELFLKTQSWENDILTYFSRSEGALI